MQVSHIEEREGKNLAKWDVVSVAGSKYLDYDTV